MATKDWGWPQLARRKSCRMSGDCKQPNFSEGIPSMKRSAREHLLHSFRRKPITIGKVIDAILVNGNKAAVREEFHALFRRQPLFVTRFRMKFQKINHSVDIKVKGIAQVVVAPERRSP
ncbi:hypothetical protein [Burkholderia sp. BCC1999]|uniref:hypothetical protein n=1 Tax=Burkholderia sp. BCC1999 TaxID=2817448 RepID=UPI002AC335D1|nr:hypothetical protein [Burkholderia sp. BCC1999]